MSIHTSRSGIALPDARYSALFLAVTSALAILPGGSALAACGTLATSTYTASQTCTPTAGSAGSLSTQAGTVIRNSTGVSLLERTTNADATLLLDGTTIEHTPTTAANGVLVQILGTAAQSTASVQLIGSASSVQVSGAGLDGIGISNASLGPSSFSVANGTGLNIRNTVGGSEHDGIDINASGGGDISFQHNGLGSITTYGGNNIWLKAIGSGNVNATVGSAVSLTVDNNDPLSAGDPNIGDESNPTAGTGNHAGVHTRAVNGNTTVNNAAVIRGMGTNAFGIFTEGGAGNTSLTNTGSINTNGTNGFGIRSIATSGSINVVNSGNITTTGEGGHGIYVNDNVGATGNISIQNDGLLEVGATPNSAGSRAINVMKRGTGSTTVTGKGDIRVHGGINSSRAYGIIIAATDRILVDYSGNISASGPGAGGIRADSTGSDVRVNYTGNSIETFNSNANGIYATTTQGTVQINATGSITTHSATDAGEGRGVLSFGLQAQSSNDDVSVTFTGSRIDVNGSGAAIFAGTTYASGNGQGAIMVDNSGELIARGNSQRGIRTLSVTGDQHIVNRGAITTQGDVDSQGILALASGAASITVENSGNITTRGSIASGINALTQGGSASVSNSAAILGGWGSSTGVSLAGETQTLANTGSIGALSDRAVLGDASGPDATVTIDNGGLIVGSVNAATSQVSVANKGAWTLRNYADSNGDGSRDTWGVALSNLGSASGNLVDNSGTLTLAAQPASGIQAFDSTGAYLPLGQSANQPTQGGAVQGQLLGVGSFSNSGTIDLTGGAKAVGNVLLISNAQVAGSSGGGVFVSNGGRLVLNTELNEGGANSRSDMLVVDSTSTGSGGATGLLVNNVGGRGELTEGNGIAVVNLLDSSPAASDPGAFSLARRVVAGPYEYQLYRGAEDGSGTDTWYLRSDIEPTPPAPPEPHHHTPNFRPEVSLYGAIPALALVYGRTMVDTLHERVGEERPNAWDSPVDKDEATWGPSMGWGRVIYRSGKQDGDRKDAVGNTPQYNYDLTAFQVGADLYRKERTDGSHDQAGFSLGVGSMDAGVSHYTGRSAGDDTLRAYSLGGYWTHFGPEGWYLDGVLQASRYEIEARPNQLSKLKTRGWGYTASLEGGYPYEADKDLWVEPQAQVIYGYIDLDDSDDIGADVRFRDVESLIGRLGIRIAKDWETEGSDKTRRRTQGWIRPSVWHEFKGQPKTEFSSQSGYIPFEANIDGTWGEVNLGVDYQASERTTFTVSAGYREAFDGDSHGYDAMLGFKYWF
ncbi:autotransporter outer membrane beta-barrel domain-containing protein [Pseudomonas sp. ZM23]|uniref:Autotransporter outer membrane beta-barrel domain-containing protein n=1 Tax=Pseudomonas triclosanedens TaxID=2961893 RepID=A0ABY6ZQQ7_9PSED|nr:autotransporter outer membrane beta-barrel domain-containing protein [Pseudomonas triclosanedens]MCP8467637.1 autotransporter outer membrane beta-barrel domain-containing protein [Pseudomonas triclosanedens]MCP8473383.1 autotransporter outer membrane beta-barrel domain-containing protein [Pseudomonas triclosanedens]MCP8479412.1 autotransporter outer membrane beta-barrel domain-containing protein [Pseudomonas triclosanedens]WAI47105.1 autotransporter outer membrane beta-barrel domain-containi